MVSFLILGLSFIFVFLKIFATAILLACDIFKAYFQQVAGFINVRCNCGVELVISFIE